MWRDRKWRHRKWRHKIDSGWFPLGCDLYCSRCCIVLQRCFLSRLRSHCGISTNLKAAERGVYAAAAVDRDIHRLCWQRDICRRRRSCSNTYRVMKKNPIIFWKPIIRFILGFQMDTIPIISCHGYIRLPVWLQDLQAVENRCLSDGSFPTSNTWWLPSQIGSYGVMVNIRRCMEP